MNKEEVLRALDAHQDTRESIRLIMVFSVILGFLYMGLLFSYVGLMTTKSFVSTLIFALVVSGVGFVLAYVLILRYADKCTKTREEVRQCLVSVLKES